VLQGKKTLLSSFCHAENGSPKFFSSEENPKNPEITPRITSNGGRPLHHHKITNQKAPWQAVQLPLQWKNHHAPNLHTVASSLCTVVFPQLALQASDHH
jgi:hypothetical protein